MYGPVFTRFFIYCYYYYYYAFFGGGGGGGLSSPRSFQLQSCKRSHGKAIGGCSLQQLQKVIAHKEKTKENAV